MRDSPERHVAPLHLALQVIITKLDGHAKGGGALSAVSATQGHQVAGEFTVDLDGFLPKTSKYDQICVYIIRI